MNILEIIEKDKTLNDKSIIIPQKINIDEHFEIIKKIALYLQPKYIFTEETSEILRILLLYFSGQKEGANNKNESCGKLISLSKGIFLVGGVGVGKSLIFEIFKIYTTQVLKKNGFQYHSANSIIDFLNIDGKVYYNLFKENRQDENTIKPITCYIDDIASKNEIVKHFGTEYNAIQELISIRYEVFIRHKKLTHLSTNIFPQQLKEIYGSRVIDRMREMFNIIELKGESFRK